MRCGLWLGIFLALVAGGGLLARDAAIRLMANEASIVVTDIAKVRVAVLGALGKLNRDVIADTACSPALRTELRRVAFLPDGLSEFLHIIDNRIVCSVTEDLAATPIDLGPPDIVARDGSNSAIWMNRMIVFGGVNIDDQMVVRFGAFGTLVPPTPTRIPSVPWIRTQHVTVAGDGTWWHRAGDTGLYKPGDHEGGNVSPNLFHLRLLHCDSLSPACIAVEADLLAALPDWALSILLLLVVFTLLAIWIADWIIRLHDRHWSLEARLRRGLTADRVVCHYQPLLNLHTGRFVGCEVLARWRDTDGTLVYPDAFIPKVEKLGRTRSFTALVIKRAFEDLSDIVPAGMPFQVNVNIFPRDFDAKVLIGLFQPFRTGESRFQLAVELVESATVNVEALSHAVEQLKAADIATYIDDFGTGYANMQTLAGVPIDGVKLDKSFAMAPNDSMMARMLRHALEMIAVLGRVTVVEGIETDERLAMLKASGLADFGQGYGIAPPMTPEALANFLRRPRMVRVA